MIQSIYIVLARWLIVNSVRVEAKCLGRSINGHRQRTVLEQSQLEGIRIVGGHIDESLNGCHQRHVVHVTVAILAQIGTVLLLRGHSAGLQHPLVHAEILATIAAIVAIGPRAVNQRLLGKPDQIAAILQEEGALQVTNGAK